MTPKNMWLGQTEKLRTIIARVHSGNDWLLYSVVGMLIFVPALIKLAYYAAYPGSDDAFIHLAIARNVAAGQGWGINVGEPRNLSSSPIFTLMLTLANLLGLDALTTGKVLSVLFSAGALLLLWLLLSAVTQSAVLRLSGLILGAFNVHLWRWNGVVMETSLAVLFVYLIFYLYYGRRRMAISGFRLYFLIGFTVGLATLVRFELAILLGCVLADLFLNARQNRLRYAALLCAGFVLGVAPWYAFSYAYFGSLLPTTFYAKTSSLQYINLYVARQIGTVMLSAYGLPLLAALALLAYVLRSKPAWDTLKPFQRFIGVMLFPVLLCGFYYLKTEYLQSASRYIIPALAAIPIICILVAERCRQTVDFRRFGAIILTIAIFNAALALILNQLVVTPVLRSFDENYWTTMKTVASLLEDRTADNDVVLVEVDIGVLAYYSDHSFYIADGGGLASPELQGLTVPEHITVSRPKYVVESIGMKKGDLAKSTPDLELVYHRRYKSHGTSAPDEQYFCNVYRYKPSHDHQRGHRSTSVALPENL